MPEHIAPLAHTGKVFQMEYSREVLTEAKRQIDSTLHKLRETIRTFEAKEDPQRYRSQITLAKRRIEAFTIAMDLIERELKGNTGDGETVEDN